MPSDATKRPATRTRRASDALLFSPPTREGQRARYPLITLRATTVEKSAGAGFAMRGPLAVCLAEALRLQAWAQRLPHDFEYALRVAQTSRVVKRSKDLTRVLEELYRAAEGSSGGSTHTQASRRALPS